MTQPLLSVSRRLRRTPFPDRVTAAGVQAYTVYNHVLLPTVFRSVEEDYRHLKSAVQLWDVSCERQVEVRGPDAGKLLQMLTPRDMRGILPGRRAYAPMADETGGMLNDPVVLKLAEDRYWISIADSDLLFWVKGIAYCFRLDVLVDEPDISPLAVQGPKAGAVMSEVFGDSVRDPRFFRFGWFEFGGRQHVVARSGYSKQGGFEIYLNGGDLGEALWDSLLEAGKHHDIHAGCPNLIERVESGLLSYGNDMDMTNTPHECGLGRFCSPQTAIGCVGRDPLLRVATEGPVREIRSLSFKGAPCRDVPSLGRCKSRASLSAKSLPPSGRPISKPTSLSAWFKGRIGSPTRRSTSLRPMVSGTRSCVSGRSFDARWI